MSPTLHDLPEELLEHILRFHFESQPQKGSKDSLCVNRTFYNLGLPLLYRSLTLTPNNMGAFPLLPADDVVELTGTNTELQRVPSPSCGLLATRTQLAMDLRNLCLDLPSFLGAARFRTTCCQNPYAGARTRSGGTTYLYGNDWKTSLNDTLAELADTMPSLEQLKAFELKAWRQPLCLSCCGDGPFLHEKTVCALLSGVSQCKQLRELDFDTKDAEIYACNDFRLDHRPCEGHVCAVLAKTVVSLPKLRVLKVKRAEVCSACLDFERWMTSAEASDSDTTRTTTNPILPNLTTIHLDLRTRDLFHVKPSTYEARARPCNTICPCLPCTEHAANDAEAKEPSDPVNNNNRTINANTSNDDQTKDTEALKAKVEALLAQLPHPRPRRHSTDPGSTYSPWPRAYVPATANVHAHWHMTPHLHASPGFGAARTATATANEATGEAGSGNEGQDEHVRSFLTSLLSMQGKGMFPRAKDVKVTLNAHASGPHDNRFRRPVELDVLKGVVRKLYDEVEVEGGDGGQMPDCEATAMRAWVGDGGNGGGRAFYSHG